MHLRWYQSEAVDAAWRFLTYERGNPAIVLPTGAGKSLVIAKLCQDAVERFSGRVIVLAHRKELIEQNAEKVARLLPLRKIGLFSAGLRRWNSDSEIVLAGIQSCYQKSNVFGARHLVIVDEAHLVPLKSEGRYRTFVDDLRQINPHVRIIGLTATPYRTGEGALCRPDGIFQRVCYEASIPRLIKEGFLAEITNQTADGSVDTHALRIRGGEFIPSDVEQAFDKDAITRRAVAEIVTRCVGRTSILLFAAGVLHAEHVAATVQEITGERCGVITGDSLDLERAELVRLFRERRLRWLVNVDVLTTGFDAPVVDAIAILRATCSPGLFAQIVGRGFRMAPGKKDCLVLDFGGNIQRHGPLDDPEYGKASDRRGDGVKAGEVPLKACPNCEAELMVQTRQCECGFLFPINEGPRHGEQAEQQATLLAAQAKPVAFLVEAVNVRRHDNQKKGTTSLRVDYECQPTDAKGNLTVEVISEWVCLEHDGFAGQKARDWWRKRCEQPVSTVDEAVELWHAGAVATPTRIVARKEGRWWRVLEYTLDPRPPREEWEPRLQAGDAEFEFAAGDEEPF